MSKHSLLMKFGQFMSYYKIEKNTDELHKSCNLKISSRHFCL